MALKPLSTEQLTALIGNLCTEPIITKTFQEMPLKLRQELISNDTAFLQGFLEGCTRAMQVAQSTQLLRQIGQAEKASLLQAMLNATALLCARELLKRGEEVTTKVGGLHATTGEVSDGG